MNIFYLDESPVISAKYLADVHIVKMGLESVQLLCTNLSLKGFITPYKPSHAKHPCQLWLNESVYNVLWLVEHAQAIFNEYTKRYGKQHKSELVLNQVKKIIDENLHVFPDKGMTSPKLAMPDEYKKGDTVESYRSYYISKKQTSKRALNYKNGNIPYWF